MLNYFISLFQVGANTKKSWEEKDLLEFKKRDTCCLGGKKRTREGEIDTSQVLKATIKSHCCDESLVFLVFTSWNAVN